MATSAKNDAEWFKEQGLTPPGGKGSVTVKLPEARPADAKGEAEAARLRNELYWRKQLAGQGDLKAAPPRSKWERFIDNLEHTMTNYGPANIVARNVAPLVETGDGSTVEQRRERARNLIRERRENFAAVDPADSVGDYVADILGSIAGSAASDPTTYLGAGSGKNLGEKLINMSGLNALADAVFQGVDIAEDVQDEYNPVQGAVNVAIPPVLAGVGRAGGKIRLGLRIQRGVQYPDWRAVNDVIVRDLEGGGTLANPKTSPKGAMGPQQVMPDTARKPGFGIRPWNGKTQADLARVGRQYSAAMMDKYNGDTAKVLAAYNAGPGRVDGLIKRYGDDWQNHLPDETKAYVRKGLAKLGGPVEDLGTPEGVRPMDPREIASIMNDPEAAGIKPDEQRILDEANDSDVPVDDGTNYYNDSDLDNSLIQIADPDEFSAAMFRAYEKNPRWVPGDDLLNRIKKDQEIQGTLLKVPLPNIVAKYGYDPSVSTHESPFDVKAPNPRPDLITDAEWRDMPDEQRARMALDVKRQADRIKLTQETPEFRFDKPTIVGREATLGDGFGANSGDFSIHFQPMRNGLWKIRAINPGEEGFPSFRIEPENDVSGYWDPKTNRFTVDAEGKQQIPVTPLVRDAINKAFDESKDFRDGYFKLNKTSFTEDEIESHFHRFLKSVDHEIPQVKKDNLNDFRALEEHPDPKERRAAMERLEDRGFEIHPEIKKKISIEAEGGKYEKPQIWYQTLFDLFRKILKNESGSFRPFGRRGYREGPETGSTGPREPFDGSGPTDPEEKLLRALRQAKPISAEQRAVHHAIRSEQAGYLRRLQQEGRGLEGHKMQKAALRGELPRVDFESFARDFTDEDVHSLLNRIDFSNSLREFEKINAKDALLKLLGAEGAKIPTPHEIKLLSGIFSEDLIKELLTNRTAAAKFWDAVGNVVNAPRTIMSSYDLSAPFRQGLALVGTKEFWKAYVKMFKYFGSKQAFDASQEAIRNHPNFLLSKDANLSLADMGHYFSDREEAFLSQWATKVPGVRMSNQAYVGFLNKLRFDTFNKLIEIGEANGVNFHHDKDALRKVAAYINAATGRGSLGKYGNAAAPALASVFFSPRLIASRLQMLNPALYATLPPGVRKESIKNLLTMAGAATIVLGLAKAGGAEVSTDSNSSDFLKAKFGNTRYDVLGGFQQYMVFLSRMVTGKTTTSKGAERDLTSGKFGQDTRLDILERFGRGKLNPAVGYAADALAGSNVIGEPFEWDKNTLKLFIPLAAQDIADVVKENDNQVEAGILGVPAIFGIGAQTYSPRPSKARGKEVDPFAPFEPIETSDDAWLKENGFDTTDWNQQ